MALALRRPLLGTILLTLGLLAPRLPAQAAGPTASTARTAPLAADSARAARFARADLARIRGQKSAKVWLVVMSDFQCPYCKTWHDETAPQIERDYVATGKVQVAYLNFIAVPSHRNAPAAHEAAMCAAEQERFFPMADALFASQREWKSRNDPAAYFDAIAVRLKLDLPRYRRCVTDGAMRPLIDADQDRVVRLGMGATPAFLVGGRRLVGAQPYAVFKRELDSALVRAAAPR